MDKRTGHRTFAFDLDRILCILHYIDPVRIACVLVVRVRLCQAIV